LIVSEDDDTKHGDLQLEMKVTHSSCDDYHELKNESVSSEVEKDKNST
jgi:hypothetical protein